MNPKASYTTPRLTVHGSVGQITELILAKGTTQHNAGANSNGGGGGGGGGNGGGGNGGGGGGGGKHH